MLPNEKEDDPSSNTKNKPLAYMGLRHAALDPLVAAENILAKKIELLYFADTKCALKGIRREFVSNIQSILDPRSMNKSIAVILRHAQKDRAKDKGLAGLLEDPGKPPQGAKSVVQIASKRSKKMRE